MKQSTVAIFVVIGALAAGAALYWEQKVTTATTKEALVDKPLFPAENMGKVDEIVIKNSSEQLSLKKGAEGNWSVINEQENYPADAKAIVKILDDVNRAKVIRLAGELKDPDDEYGSAKAKELILKSGSEETFHWFFADSRSSGGAYAYKNGETKVYLISEALRFEPAAASYESKLIFKNDEKMISKIILRQKIGKGKKAKEQVLTLERATAEEKFKLLGTKDEKKEIPEDKQSRLLSALKEIIYQERVSADNAAAQQALEGDFYLEFSTFDNKSMKIMLGNFAAKDAKDSYLKILEADGFDAAETARLAIIKNWAFKVSESSITPFLWGEKDLMP